MRPLVSVKVPATDGAGVPQAIETSLADLAIVRLVNAAAVVPPTVCADAPLNVCTPVPEVNVPLLEKSPAKLTAGLFVTPLYVTPAASTKPAAIVCVPAASVLMPLPLKARVP